MEGIAFKNSAICANEHIDNARMTDVSAPMMRRNFILSEISLDNECTVQISSGSLKKCIMCHEEMLLDEISQKCESNTCKNRMHIRCITKYNRDSFNFAYSALPECQNARLCPLHACAACNEDGLKQTAYLESKQLIECAVCFRAFHTQKCVPAGSRRITVTVENIKKKMIICPEHCPIDETIQKRHIETCQKDCELSAPLIPCTTCPQKFHRQCQSVDKVGGELAARNRCTRCLRGEVIRLDVPVLASYKEETEKEAKLYLAFTRAWSKHEDKEKVKTATESLGRHGYVVLEWVPIGKEQKKCFSIMHLSKIIPLKGHFIPKKDNEVKAKWMEILKNFEKAPLYLPTYKSVRNYLNDVRAASVEVRQKMEVSSTLKEDCDCSSDSPSRCTSDNCLFVNELAECRNECIDESGRQCTNNEATKRKLNEKLTVRQAGKKGLGVFAKCLIKKGEFLAIYGGEAIGTAESTRRKEAILYSGDKEGAFYHAKCGEDTVIDAGRYGNEARYLNHSCDPNCVFRLKLANARRVRKGKGEYEMRFERRLCLFAHKDIRGGQELTIDYQMDEMKMLARCMCNAKNCTGRMGKKEVDKRKEKEDERKSAKKRKRTRTASEDKENRPSTSSAPSRKQKK